MSKVIEESAARCAREAVLFQKLHMAEKTYE
jgi:hypothetical protein